MDIIEKLINEEKYGMKSGKRMKEVKWITIHETNSMKSAEDYADFLVKGYFPESCHYVVDEKVAVHIIPDSRIAHHCGDGAYGEGNCTSIGIEICRNESEFDWKYEKAKENCAELVAKLMKLHKIDIKHVVPHDHWDGSGCPKRMLKEDKWNEFISMVKNKARI